MKKKNVFLCVVLAISLSALLARSPSVSNTGPKLNREQIPLNSLSHSIVKFGEFLFEAEAFTDTPAAAKRCQTEKSLSLEVKLEKGIVSMKLTNPTSSSLEFYNSLEVDAERELPAFTYIQVRNGFEELYDKWPISNNGLWTPLSLTSQRVELPTNLQRLSPGESIYKSIPLNEFFFRSNFELGTPGFEVRVIARVYTNASLGEYIESRTEWMALAP